MIEELKCVLVGKLDDWMLQATDLFKHLVSDLRIQANSAMLELMERAVERLVDASELVLKPFHLRLVLELGLFQPTDLVLQLVQVGLPPLDILFSFHQEEFLFFVVLGYSFL